MGITYYTPTIDQFVEGFEFQLLMHCELGKVESELPEYKSELYTTTKTFSSFIDFTYHEYLKNIVPIALDKGYIRAKQIKE